MQHGQRTFRPDNKEDRRIDILVCIILRYCMLHVAVSFSCMHFRFIIVQ